MHYKKLRIFVFLLIIFFGCSKAEKDERRRDNSTDLSDIIYGLKTDSTTALADGTTLIHVYCMLDSLASSDRYSVLFKINIGKFIGSTTDTTIISQAQFSNNSLIASAVIQVPQTPGQLIISAQPNLPIIQNNNYIIRDTLNLLPSIPDSISLTESNSGVASNYGSEVTFTATLFNNLGGKVSFGNKVVFTDSLAGPKAANGNWRSIVDTVNVNSQATAIYSIGGPFALSTPIYITCSLLDVYGKPTYPVGKTIIFINK